MQNTIHFVVLNTFVVLIVLVMVWPTPSRLRQQQEVMAGTGIWRCNACFFSWAPMKVPCSVNLKVNNATRKTRRFNRVDYRTLSIIHLWISIYRVRVSQMKQWTHLHLLVHTSDIQRKVISTRIVSNPRFPLSARKVAHANQRLFFGFKNAKQKGEYKAFCIGGVLSSDT
jgi:hypothetical protein